MANLITVRLQRGDGQAWGFRLQGGKDFSAPLVLQRVSICVTVWCGTKSKSLIANEI